MTRPSRLAPGRIAGLLAAIAVLAAMLLVPVASASAADGLKMNARALMQGHVRAGSWFAIAVDLENAGPTVTGELRISGGVDSRTRFGTPVELATGSRKEYVLYALPPTFGGNMTVELVSGTQVVAKSQVAVALHDQTQLVVGLVAENPASLVGQLDLLPNQNGLAPVIVPLAVGDLPERVQAWAPLDRLIWQDVDAASLTPAQLAALRTWIAGGGRLVIVGGTGAARRPVGVPGRPPPLPPDRADRRRPRGRSSRCSARRPPARRRSRPSPATRAPGRTLADVGRSRDRGRRRVRLGHGDPARVRPRRRTGSPMATRSTCRSGAASCRRDRAATSSLVDDQTIVSAVTNLPSLALPPIGALLVLLLGYIVLVGPVNYLVLRWLDRREWAWVTVPVLIAVFTVGVVRDRRAAPRLGRDRQRGRDRPRRPGHRRGDGPVLPRDLQPVAGDVPAARRRATPCSRRR